MNGPLSYVVVVLVSGENGQLFHSHFTSKICDTLPGSRVDNGTSPGTMIDH
jgi:hypothetical protein